MSKDLTLFPTLTDDIRQKIQFHEAPYNFFYQDDAKHELRCKDSDDSKTYSLFEENGPWNVDEYNFGFSRTYSIKFHQFLFGENGVACKNSVLNIAIIWTSPESKQRGVIIADADIKLSETPKQITISHLFERAQLRGCVNLQTVLYIKTKGSPNKDEKHLANTSGLILGELDNEVLLLDGNGSSFPVIIVQEPRQPLWWVKCDWEDPTTDLFSESVAIYLNEKHKSYTFIDRKSSNYNPQLVQEIFSQALFIIITKLKENEAYWEDTINENHLGPGSVSEAIAYFSNTLNWNLQTVENTSLSIRKFFEGKLSC